MAFLAVTSLMRTLELQFLQPQPRVILTNKEQIMSVHEKLGHLLVFLEECEKKGNNRPEMKELTEKIREVSVKAEDDIEAELLNGHHYQKLDQALQRVVEDIEELMQTTRNTNHHLVNNLTVGSPSQPTSNVEDNAVVGHSEELNKVKFQPTNKEQIKSVHEKLGHLLVYLEESEKKEVTKRIRGVTVKAEDDIEAELFEKTLQRVVHDVEELMQITRNTDHSANNNPTVGGSYQRTSDVEDAMVGHIKELKEVKSQLLRPELKQHQVMAMVGMGGIGKTTFVKRIYEDSDVTSHFDLRAWTTMSQVHNKAQALYDLCRCIMSMSSTFNNKMEGDLEAQLRQSLLGQRYLIVVDDIWTKKAWDDIKGCFPNDENNGSRILLTTRDRKIAQYADSGEYCYKMRFLNSDEGWDLFCQKFLAKEFLNNNEFETIGKNIVQTCQGLPLTIVVLAGLLSTIKSVDEWENVESTINSFLTLNLSEQFSRIFNLSYNSLPSDLKGCFLYLGLFHEDCEIPSKKLIRLWIAEGFVGTMSDSKRLEEIGGDYLQNLIDRSLIMVHMRSFDGKIKTCKMHDLLHELCISKAEIENLLCLENKGSSNRFGRFIRLGGSRWLSLEVAIPAFHLVIASGECRSILCFNMAVNCDREWYLLADSFKKLRVLDLSKINFKKGMPADITDLIFLRYLAIASCKVLNRIPLWKNWNLQTLLVTEDDNGARRLPPGIWYLPQLRHLEIYHQISIDHPKVIQEDLQTLYWLSMSECTMEVCSRIPNVKELGIIAKCKAASSVSQGLDNLCCLKDLEKLKVIGSYRCPLHLPPHIEANNFPQNLQKLTFVRTLMPWEAMSIISMLPNLEVLKLKNFACVGQDWELIQEGGFPKLKVLLISFTNLKEWKADVDTPFPKLQRLLLRNCFELKEMPEWIDDIINTLQLIKLEYCYASLVRSAQRIKQEQLDNYGNERLDVIDSSTRQDDEDHAKEEDRSNEQTCEVESVCNDLTSLWFEARKLRITWGHDPTYWIWTFDSDSGHDVAELEKVSAFDIGLTFDIRCLYKMSCYSAYLVFKQTGIFENVYTALAAVRYEKDNARYGWMNKQNWHSNTYVYPKMGSVRVEGGNHNIITVFLGETKSYGDCSQFPDSRSDGWMEIKLGDFYVSSGNEGEVQLRLWHTSNQYWKSGFVVRGVEIRPAN